MNEVEKEYLGDEYPFTTRPHPAREGVRIGDKNKHVVVGFRVASRYQYFLGDPYYFFAVGFRYGDENSKHEQDAYRWFCALIPKDSKHTERGYMEHFHRAFRKKEKSVHDWDGYLGQVKPPNDLPSAHPIELLDKDELIDLVKGLLAGRDVCARDACSDRSYAMFSSDVPRLIDKASLEVLIERPYNMLGSIVYFKQDYFDAETKEARNV